MKLPSTLRTFSFFLAVATLPCAGCFADSEAPVLTVDVRLTDPQGPILQGPEFNGYGFNSKLFNGLQLNGAQFAGAFLPGSTVAQQLFLRGGQLFSSSLQNIEGAMLQATLSDGSSLRLQIADVTPTNDAEIYEYTVRYFNGSEWGNLCGESNGVPVPALALAGRWDESAGTATGGDHIEDPSLFTFACKNAVLAKCVLAGYAPWRSITECDGADCQTISMRDMHQACTRMMRADYCGDGTPHTQNGTLINIWDNFDIQTRDTDLPVNWTHEAEWSPNGAVCTRQVRWSGTAENYISRHCPERWASSSFDCFGQHSTFFTAPGYDTPIATRSLFRNQFTHDTL